MEKGYLLVFVVIELLIFTLICSMPLLQVLRSHFLDHVRPTVLVQVTKIFVGNT